MIFNWKTDYLALDFDGVVINSVEECLLVSFNTFADFSHTRLVDSLDQIDPFFIAEFKRMRNFIRAGADFVYIVMAITQNVSITNQRQFDNFCDDNKDLEKIFFDEFYKKRDQLSIEKPDLWLKLNPLYPGLLDFLLQYPDKKHLFIITTKKIFFVQKILSYYNIPFINTHLFNADKNRSKKSIILELLDKFIILPLHFWFVDDQIDTLIKIQDTQINCLLAEWGYNDNEQVQLAKQNQIPGLKLDDFAKTFIF